MANTATPPSVLKLSTRVQVAAGSGYIRFVGQTGFAAGKWVGVELDEATGKNDGSVAGKRYFTCAESKGVFVRPSQIRLLLDDDTPGRADSPTPMAPPPRPSTTRPASRTAASRPPSTTTTTTTSRPATAAARRPSVAASVSGRSSVASATSDTRVASPTKLTRPAVTAPRLSARSTSSSSAGSSTSVNPFAPDVVAATPKAPPVSHTRRPSTAAMPPPITPSTARRLQPPSASARKPAASTPNFAPPAGGTPRGATAVKMGRTQSTESQSSTGSAVASRRSSMARSPPPQSPRFGLTRQMSAAMPVDQVAEVSPFEGLQPAEPFPVEPESVSEPARPDPFSLKSVEVKRPAEVTVPRREHDELLAKLRILEARRAEDRDKLREIDKLREEAEEWEKVKDKTKTKIAELAAEVRDLKKQNKDIVADRDDIRSKFDDFNDQVEISLLDKEVAEERFEAAESALEQLKERAAELEVEVTVLREENARLEGEGDAEIARGDSGDTKSNLAFIQLEKQNGRLKDALMRLRDLTSESENESKRKIADLEKELDLTSDLQAEFDNNMVELERAESQIEDLKAQLDDALGAEDMLEQLTERNLNLSEKIEELQALVEDLEALKELNDELEESHVETERQMQEELDLKDLHIRDVTRRAHGLEENVADYEGTIGQFRELVLSLQADLEHLRTQQASQQSESQSLTSQSQAMLNLNLKLQSTVLKSQVKTIDLELRRLDAQQASEHLAIVKPYLLPAFFDEDSDAVESLLFFERMGYKADLISMMIDQRHSIGEALTTVVPEALVEICETRAKLSHYASLNKRFAAQLRRCEPAVFLKMGRVYREVASTEKRVNSFIESLRKEELREVECGREVEGFIAQSEHLAELHLEGSVLDLAEREQGFVATLDLDLDTIAAAVGFTKQSLATLSTETDVEMQIGDASLDDILFKPLQAIVDQARSAKVVAKKLLRRIDDLVSNSSALGLEHSQGFETLAFNSSAIAGAVAKLSTDAARYVFDIRASKQPFQLTSLMTIMKDIASSELGQTTARPLDEINALLAQLAQDTATTLSAAMDAEHVVKLDYDPPWLARVTELQSSAATNIDAERKVLKLNEDMRELAREMRIKDQSQQESAVKIELMERRLESVKKQADALAQLELELAKAKKQEKAYEDAIEALQGDLDNMEQELSKAKLNAPSVAAAGAERDRVDGEPAPYEGNMETTYLVEQIESLRGALRFLRSENSYLKSQDLLAELDKVLPPTALPAPSPTTNEPTGLPAKRLQPAPVDPHAFATRSKALLREVRLASCSPRLVDLSTVGGGQKAVAGAGVGGRGGWQPRSRTPRAQLTAEKERWKSLRRRVELLREMRPREMALPALVSI